MRRLAVAMVLLLVACESVPLAGARAPISDVTVANFALPEHGNVAPSLRRPVWTTGYVVWPTKEDRSKDSVPLLDKRRREFGVRLSRSEWCNAAMEGTAYVRLDDGSVRTFNYDAMLKEPVADCSSVFPRVDPQKISAVNRSAFQELPEDAKFGLGANEAYRLIPFRSVAVDVNTFELGSVLYIPKLRGVSIALPDGRQVAHDGYVVAVDTGGLIRQQHIDFFKGPNRDDSPPAAIQSSEGQLLDAYLVTDPAIRERLLRPHQRSVGS